MSIKKENEDDFLSQEKVSSEDEITDKKESQGCLTAAQRARAERNRQQAREKREARLVQQPNGAAAGAGPVAAPSRALDTGGGFLLEEAAPPAPRAAPPPAPVVLRDLQPECLLCEARFPQSYLFDTFDYNVCDNCRDEDDAHSLVTRTEAKSEFLLKDCDLDLRPPALRCVRRRNPHRARYADMRLYLRAQVEERALLVWGSRAALEAERAARDGRRERAAGTAARRRLRALRMDVRSSLFRREAARHEHAFGPETYDAAADLYRRACACGHEEAYEKM